MTLARDLAWKTLELKYRSSIANQLARYALCLNYQMLPENVVHQAKRCLLDALGCAIGAFHAPGFSICEDVVKELGGPTEATVFCSGQRTSAYNASMANSFLVRFLDYNDCGGGGHNSDAIPGIIAVAEREKADGKALLTALVISYELGDRITQAGKTPSAKSWSSTGWTADARAGLSMPPALGKLMGLNEDQIANAIGICASHNLPLGILDTDREENTMSKNLRFGFVSREAILSCMLAKRGFTGPVRVVEGECGIQQVILQGDMDLERMVDFSGWRILRTTFKTMCVNASTQGHALATLSIVAENDLKPEDIAAVRIKTSRTNFLHTTTLSKKYPRNAESADHSAFFVTAMVVKERVFNPDSVLPEKFSDPVVLDLIEKITVEYDSSLPVKGRYGISEITTKDGRKFQKRVDNPHGSGDDPFSDKELEDKFREMAIHYMGEDQIQKIFDTVWKIENLNDIGKLTALMVFPKP